MKLLVILSCLLLSSSLFAISVDERRMQIIKLTDEEISEIKVLSRQSGGRNPDLLLRLADKNLENARLWREKENQDFLAIPAKKRSKVNKNSFFRRSNKYYQEANSIALSITRKFKSYKRMGEVYYILGFNAKEANKQKTAAKYLARATRSSRDSDTKIKSQISLAEVYYNQKKYSNAIPLYESALGRYKSKWWTKDSFNLAWCYFRVGKHKQALSKMEDIYSKSKNKNYIDMSEQVERDIGLFYATAGSIKSGISFYKRIGVNFTDQLVKIGLSLKEQGQFSRASFVFSQALKNESDSRKRVVVLIEQLGLYEKYGKYNNHERTSIELQNSYRKNYLNEAQLTSYKFQLGKVAAILQKQVVSKTYRRLPKLRRDKADQAIRYFGYLGEIDKEKSDEYKYLQGETAFATKLNSQAFNYYKDTFQDAEKNNRSKFKMRAMEGMLAVLSLNKKSDVKDNIYVFEAYIRNWPRGKKSREIYERLFQNYLSINDYDNAKKTLDRYVKVYPKDKTQEAMIANLMDIDRKKGRNNSIRAWISAIDAGTYMVSGKYKVKLQELLTTMQIEDVQKNLNKGNKKVALVGYHEILKDPYSTKRSKINAKYNLAALYYELGDTDLSYKWSMSALGEMGASDVKKFSSSFITISNFLFTSLEFSKSATLARSYVQKLCRVKDKKKNIAYRNAAFTYLAQGDINAAETMVREGQKCRLPKSMTTEIEYEIMREYYAKKDWDKYEYYAYKLHKDNKYYSQVIDDFINLAKLHSRFNNAEKVKAFTKIAWSNYFRAKKNRQSISLESLDYFAEGYLAKMENTMKRIDSIKFAFPESVFAKRQKEKLGLLTTLTEQATEVQSVGSGDGIIKSFNYLYEAYNKVAVEIFEFKPAGKTEDYIKQFKRDFDGVGRQIKAAGDQYKAEAKSAINKNKILSKTNLNFLDVNFPVNYLGDKNYTLMDRGGK